MKFLKKLRSRITDLVSPFFVQQSIVGVRYVHFMQMDKFANAYLRFLRDNYDMSQHLVLIKGAKRSDIPTGVQHVFRLNYFFRWIYCYRPFVNYKAKNIRKFIFHSLFDYEVVEYFYQNNDLLRKKGYWFIYGADLYTPPQDERNTFVRKNVKGIITDTDGDDTIMMTKYDCHPKVFRAGYTFPISWEMIEDAVAGKTPHDFVRVQINNSCDDSIIPALKLLARFKDENIRVRVILSYGKSDKEKIRSVGRQLFGTKFETVETFLKPADYAKKMTDNDILLLNQNRQQGLGNSFVALASGVKLFIHSDVTTYQHLRSNGCCVFPTDDIMSLSWEDFVSYPRECRLQSMRNVRHFFEDSYLKGLWDKVFYED